jgi:hypothetical protein
MHDQSRFDRLRNLTPLAAAQSWLNGDFGIGDDSALIESIRRDRRVTCSDEAIYVFFAESLLRQREDAGACLDELAAI